MTKAISHPTRTARFDLPMLFAGQAQKEFTVNEAIARIAMLVHMCVESEQAAPPADPDEGKSWLVAPDALDAWNGHAGRIACWSQGAWLFVRPEHGMQCHVRSTGERLFYDGAWNRVALPAPATGGEVQDSEAREAIAQLVDALRTVGSL